MRIRLNASTLQSAWKNPDIATPGLAFRGQHAGTLLRLYLKLVSPRSKGSGPSSPRCSTTRHSSSMPVTVQRALMLAHTCVHHNAERSYLSFTYLGNGTGKHLEQNRTHPLRLSHPHLGCPSAHRQSHTPIFRSRYSVVTSLLGPYRPHRGPVREAPQQRDGEDRRPRGPQFSVR